MLSTAAIPKLYFFLGSCCYLRVSMLQRRRSGRMLFLVIMGKESKLCPAECIVVPTPSLVVVHQFSEVQCSMLHGRNNFQSSVNVENCVSQGRMYGDDACGKGNLAKR